MTTANDQEQHQKNQIVRTNSGYKHFWDPEEAFKFIGSNKSKIPKAPKNNTRAKCLLSIEQKRRLNDYIETKAIDYLSTVDSMYADVPKDMITDELGNVLSWHAFKQHVELARRLLSKKGKSPQTKKYIVKTSLEDGMTVKEITAKHPDITAKYIYEVRLQLKK